MRVFLGVFALLAACDLGIQAQPSGGGTPDATGMGSGSGTSMGSNHHDGGVVWIDAPPGVVVDSNNGCIDPVPAAQAGDGYHNPGMDCMNGCHNHGFTVAGTVFTASNNNTASVGATIRIVDANNHTVDIVSHTNGNFYTTTAVAFPLTVLATSCPDIQHMTTTVTGSGTLGCNKSGCHVAGNQIHLP